MPSSRPIQVNASRLRAADLGVLNKSVYVLALEARSMALNLTSRKMYNVMIKLAQGRQPDHDGFYKTRLSDVINFAGASTKVADRLQGYIDNMVQTTVLMHVVSEGDAQTLLLEGMEPKGPHEGDQLRDGEERRTFPLLAEVRWSFESGCHHIAWAFPPTIRQMLLSPERWAQIEFSSLIALTSYAGLALYEVLARYKDAPGGLSARHPPEWWTRVLREGGPGVKMREWRKFKSEAVNPAIAEINAKTDIQVELIEHRERGRLEQVQFRVRRQARAQLTGVVPDPADVSLPLRAAALGVREDELEPLLSEYGHMKVDQALDVLAQTITKGVSVMRRGAYLKAILENRHQVMDGAVVRDELSPAERPRPRQSAAVERRELADGWRTGRLSELEAEFAGLGEIDQAHWIDEAAKRLPDTPGVRKRLKERDWRSPVIRSAVLASYANERYGPAWDLPSDDDLAVFATARTQRDRSEL